ncbi:MAG: TMEM14 family protein [Leptolyngbyaceae cyanobacterium MO_188.B28]|nr:TMEM14 family protein [Leptolyngbyaceae cyanobacterium MO_188.B28]
MNPGVIAAIAYGVLAIMGGIWGYVQAQSKISLIAGGGCGMLLLISALLQSQGQTWGLSASVVVTLILLVAFTMRLIKTRKFMPAGLMLILGIPALMMMISQLI